MKVLIGCEFSGTVRDAFVRAGHDAMSCDLLDSDAPGKHFKGSLFDIPDMESYDLGIFHPPCTHLAVSGSRWFKDKQVEQAEALDPSPDRWKLRSKTYQGIANAMAEQWSSVI